MNPKALKAARALNIVIIAAMCIIVALFVALPFLLGVDAILKYFTRLVPTLIFCYSAGALSLWFLFVLRKLIGSVVEGNPFVKRNVVYLKRISLALLLLMFDFVFLFFIMASISVLLCVGILLLGVLCAQVLAYLIQRAAEYREEIDLTV